MIPDSERGNIVMSSIVFIRSITKAYGPEEGMNLWSRIADVLDPDIKGEVFKAMLLGEFNTYIKLRGIDESFKKLEFIRLIRNITQIGLKEAMEISRQLELGQSYDLKVSDAKRDETYIELQRLGVFM